MKKIDKILFLETLSKYHYPYQNWYLPLEKRCNKIINFDFRKNHLYYGKDLMNKKFLELVEREKPDFIFSWLLYDEFYLKTFLKIREVSPKTKTLVFFGDDDLQFESFSRYYAIFFDYCFLAQPRYAKKYKKEGIKNVFPTLGVNTNIFKPLDLKKKYDVVFIGHPKSKQAKRYESIKYLKDNGIKIEIFGWGWSNFPDLRDIYGGALDVNDLVKTINQAKINIAFSKNDYGEPHLIGKVFEAKACKSFTLVEYCKEYLDYFKEGEEMVMFRDGRELVNKIKYYLKHEKERKKTAKAAYKKVIKDFSIDKDLDKFFKEVSRDKKRFIHRGIPDIDKRIMTFTERNFELEYAKIKEELKDFDYISFKQGNCKFLEFKDYLQSYSLLKSKKDISCCDYYVHSNGLGNYLAFKSEFSFRNLNKKNFDRLININQLMVKKEYFLENFEAFKNAFYGDKISFINNTNTIFVSIPLVQIDNLTILDYDNMKQAFNLKFLYHLYSFKQKSKKAAIKYMALLLIEIMKGRTFILRSLIDIVINSDKWTKLNKLKKVKS